MSGPPAEVPSNGLDFHLGQECVAANEWCMDTSRHNHGKACQPTCPCKAYLAKIGTTP